MQQSKRNAAQSELSAPYHIGNLADMLPVWLSAWQHDSAIWMIDSNLYDLYPKLWVDIVPKAKSIIVPSGEINKNIETCKYLYNKLLTLGVNRRSLIIIAGGGVTTDMAGFVSATYMRGVPFVFIPSTLLCMADASIGGKLGVDLDFSKNLVGLFVEPEAIFCDTSFLWTLPTRQLRSGFTEVLKHGLLAGFGEWNELINKGLDRDDWPDVVASTSRFKQSIVHEDPNEQGKRKLLNLGHTLGHAIESSCLSANYNLLHGEAVAIGLLLEAQLATKLWNIDGRVASHIELGLKKLDYDLALPNVCSDASILNYIVHDKKNHSDSIRFVLLQDFGQATFDVPVPLSLIQEVLTEYRLSR